VVGEAGREPARRAAALGAFDTLRLEKGYRLWGQDIHTEHDPLAAGIGFAVRWAKDFQGKQALAALRERGVTRKLLPLLLDDPAAVVLGKEPIRADGEVAGYVTSAGYGYTIGRCIAYGWLPVELAAEGTKVEVEYFDERYAATVASEPLFDPKGERLKG
jgi:dimethylglycine oxidase